MHVRWAAPAFQNTDASSPCGDVSPLIGPALHAARVARLLEGRDHLVDRRRAGVEVDASFFRIEVYFGFPYTRHGFEGFANPRWSTGASSHAKDVQDDLFHVGIAGDLGIRHHGLRGWRRLRTVNRWAGEGNAGQEQQQWGFRTLERHAVHLTPVRDS